MFVMILVPRSRQAGRTASMRSTSNGSIAARGILRLCLLRDGNRAFGQALEDQVVQVAAGGQLHGRLDAIAGIPRAGADAHDSARLRGGRGAHPKSIQADLFTAHVARRD